MSPLRIGMLTLVFLGVGFLLFHVTTGGDPAAPPDGGKGQPVLPVVDRPLKFTSSNDCKECHPDVWAEWRASHHALAYDNPEVQKLSQGFQNRDCLPCHLPRPVLETGLGVRVLERATRPSEGVDCFTCHKVGNAILGRGPISNPDAPCNPRPSPVIGSMQLCAPCHNQHKVQEDWKQTRFAQEGAGYKDCNDCHMPKVERTRGAGAPRMGRSHLYAGAHDAAMLKTAATVTQRRGEDGALLVTVKNTGTGHNFPADERHRAADLDLVIEAKDGTRATVRVDRYRNPYRTEFEIKNPLREPGAERTYELAAAALGTLQVHAVRVAAAFNPQRTTYYPESTQIPAGEARSYTIRLPRDVASVTVKLWYRTQPYLPDEEATLLHEETVRF